MNSFPAATLRRLAIAARAPTLSATQLAQLAGIEPDLAALEWRSPHAFTRLGLTTHTAAWLAAPDEALVDSDLRWLESSGTVLLPATSARLPAVVARVAGCSGRALRAR